MHGVEDCTIVYNYRQLWTSCLLVQTSLLYDVYRIYDGDDDDGDSHRPLIRNSEILAMGSLRPQSRCIGLKVVKSCSGGMAPHMLTCAETSAVGCIV